MDKRLFRTGINIIMERAIERCAKTHGGLVAHAEDDDDQVMAFQVISVPVEGCAVIDFAFTKSFYWKLGVQTELFKHIKEPTKVIAQEFHTLHRHEFYKDERPFVLHLRDKYGIVYDPFFYERLKS